MGLRIDPIRVTVDLTEGDEIRPGIVRTSAGGIHCADCCVGGMHALEFVFATPEQIDALGRWLRDVAADLRPVAAPRTEAAVLCEAAAAERAGVTA